MPVLALHDGQDHRLRDYRDLTDVALRTSIEAAHGLYIAESAKVIGRALAAGHRPRSVLMSERWRERMAPMIQEVEQRFPEVPVLVAHETLLEEIAGFHVHRGALAAMQRPPLPPIERLLAKDARRLVILDGIVDHTNIGAIFRSAAGLGADAVLLSPQCADPLYRRSVRVSMGTVFQVPWTRIDDWRADLALLRERGYVVAALALAPQAQDLDALAAAAPTRLALMLGSEGDGLSDARIDQADLVVRIPMARGVDSLNVAAASAVALWALRPR